MHVVDVTGCREAARKLRDPGHVMTGVGVAALWCGVPAVGGVFGGVVFGAACLAAVHVAAAALGAVHGAKAAAAAAMAAV